MLRIRSDSLTREKEMFYYKDQVFSGLAYHVDDEGTLEDVSIIEDGVITGTSDDLLTMPDTGLRIDDDFLEQFEDYGPFIFQDVNFTGVSYLFEEEGQCGAEMLYVDGCESADGERTWYLTGEPKSSLANGVHKEWFIDGSLQMQSTLEGIVYNLLLTEDGQYLSSLVIEQDNLINLESIGLFKLGSTLALMGQAIDTAFVRALHDRLDLSSLNHLTIDETSVDRSFLEMIQTFNNLSVIKLKNNDALNRTDALWLKKNMRDRLIYFDDERIELD